VDYADDEDRRFVESMVPEGAIVEALVAVVSWIDPTDGSQRWHVYCHSDLPASSNIGLLEIAKLSVIARSDTGLPFRYDE
jgi:hypothetical protein